MAFVAPKVPPWGNARDVAWLRNVVSLATSSETSLGPTSRGVRTPSRSDFSNLHFQHKVKNTIERHDELGNLIDVRRGVREGGSGS